MSSSPSSNAQISTQTNAMAEKSQALLDALPAASVADLASWVRHHNGLYWDQNEPEIDDVSFDKLVETLRHKDENNAALDELGENVGGKAEEGRQFATVEHEQKMLSLDKAYDDDKLKKWRETFKGGVWVTPKIDGVACTIRYDERGRIHVAATRGNGKTGDDITQNARHLAGIPHQLDEKFLEEHDVKGAKLEVRGEVHIKLSRFKQYSKQYENPRNLTAGKLKLKDAKETGDFGLTFFAYDLLGAPYDSEGQKNKLLDALGFDRPPADFIAEDGDLQKAVHDLADKRADLDYETDGVVMKVDLVSEHKRMGATSHHPRYALAYKFQGECAQTKLVRVEWSIGRTGKVTPVAVIEPVRIAGVTITNVTLHNFGFIEKLGLKSESLVEVERAGDVIPHITRVLSAAGDDVPLPDYPVRQDGDFLYVLDAKDNLSVTKKQFAHFLKVLDIQGFGERIISTLVDSGDFREPADVFRVEVQAIASLERMGEKSALNFIRERDRKRELFFPVFLRSLGIPEVGNTVSELVSHSFPDLDTLKAATEDKLAALHGVGPSIAASLVSGLVEREEEIASLLEEVSIKAPEVKVSTGHVLEGKSVVFTGKMAKLDRKGAQKQVKDLGGSAPSSVGNDLDYLVIGDDGSPLFGNSKMSTKHKKAEGLIAKGSTMKIISETDFLVLVA
ncbi:MAG: DNA ligase (NAD(+)) LigA [Deltaproteobacteria bacterium]|nr:DNA ligase (NAD(+)) LigA [Deltaproteobacteria bacterium]